MSRRLLVLLPSPRSCYTQLTTDIAGMMGLPCSMVYGVPADSVVRTYVVLVEMDMVVDYLV